MTITEQEIIDKYPKLFRQVHLSSRESCMHFGICVCSAWLPVIDKLSEELKDLDVEYAQIKEKFGTIRIYVDVLNPDHQEQIHKLVNKYEDIANNTVRSLVNH